LSFLPVKETADPCGDSNKSLKTLLQPIRFSFGTPSGIGAEIALFAREYQRF